MKGQPTDREKIFVNDVINKGLIPKIYKQLIQFNNEKIQLKNGQKTKIDNFLMKTYRGQETHEKMLIATNC